MVATGGAMALKPAVRGWAYNLSDTGEGVA